MSKIVSISDNRQVGTEARVFDVNARTAATEIDSEEAADIMAFGLSIVRAGNRLQQDMENIVHRPEGSTWAAFRVLFAIRAMGDMSPKRLAKLSSTSPASISSVLKTLEKKGLTQKTPDPSDARSVLVSLTKLGHATVADHFKQTNNRMAQWTSFFTREEREMITALLQRLLSVTPGPDNENIASQLGVSTI